MLVALVTGVKAAFSRQSASQLAVRAARRQEPTDAHKGVVPQWCVVSYGGGEDTTEVWIVELKQEFIFFLSAIHYPIATGT